MMVYINFGHSGYHDAERWEKGTEGRRNLSHSRRTRYEWQAKGTLQVGILVTQIYNKSVGLDGSFILQLRAPVRGLWLRT
jgi:hypothetical protein